MDLVDFPPMLPDGSFLAFDLPGWIYEVKLDGYRITALCGNGKCRLRTRNGADATAWFPEVVRSLEALRGGPYIVDGEVCVFDDRGRSNFWLLRDRARRRRWYQDAEPVEYAIFDLLVHSGTDITAKPLGSRKVLLAGLLGQRRQSIEHVRYLETVTERLFAEPVLGSGLVAKRIDSPYKPGLRSTDWVNIEPV